VPASGRIRIGCPPGAVAAHAAHRIVELARDDLPDLSHHVVLVPDLHAAAALAAELRAAAGVPVLFLPRILTLHAWAATVPVGRPVASVAAREVALQLALARRGWLRDADLWAVAAELAALFEELTRWKVSLPDDPEDFLRRLTEAYGAMPAAALRFEARLVHELWFAAAGDPSELSPEAAHQVRLATLAERAAAPLWAVALGPLPPAEEAFLGRYAARAPVVELQPDTVLGGPVEQALQCAWPRVAEPPVRERALALRAQLPVSPLAGRIAFFGATSVEEEAEAIDAAVRQWLLVGRRSIAVVVHDRVVARRARALLERAGVLVEDEAGWAFSTTSAATVVGRLFDVVSGDWYHRDLLDLLKSPFVFGDRPRDVHRGLVWRLEQCVREAGFVAGLEPLRAAVRRRGDSLLEELLVEVERGVAALGRERRSLAGWLDALQAALAALGVAPAFARDAAGEQLLDLLAGLRRDVARHGEGVSFGDFRRWLARALERATFRDRAIDSPVVFTHLAATRLRRFDAVVFVGCDAAHFPGNDTAAMFFNQGVRAELGLPTRADELAQLELDAAALIAGSGETLVTWQRSAGGEANLLSPVFERLRTVSRIAWGDDLASSAPGDLAAAARVDAPDPAPLPVPITRPAPAVPSALVPGEISASAYNALLACPYQFHARYVLRLAAPDEIEETVDKRDFGERLHGALARFHAHHPVIGALAPDEAQRELIAAFEASFGDALARDYLARGWLEHGKALVPAYLDWQRAREAAGWRWHAAEEKHRLDIPTPAGNQVTLVGRLDRIDSGAQGLAVIDYKTTRHGALQRRAKDPTEEVQLVVYALLRGGGVSGALYVTIDREGVHELPLEGDLAWLTQACRDRLAALIDAMHAGVALPANGTDEACTYCEVHGLCRRAHWP